MGLPALRSIAAAPTFPFMADPSENTWTSFSAFLASFVELSLSSGMLIVKGFFVALIGSQDVAGIFSILIGLMLSWYQSRRWCRAVQWCFTFRVFFHFIVLCSGWSSGNMAILVSAIWQRLSMFSRDGRRNAHASSASVGEVRRPPVITVAAARCRVVNCLVTLAEPMALGPGCSFCVGVHQRLTA